MKLLKTFEYTSSDRYPVTINVYEDEAGMVLEQIKVYDFDGSKSVDAVFLPAKFFEKDS